jgi:ribosomal protein RSM22 (predicted rRNA methylase)
MPATFAAVMQALTHLKHVIPAFSPASVLDVGSGPGTAAFGAMLSFPTIQAGLGLERSDEFCRLAQTLFLTVRPQASFQTKKMELEREPSSLDSFDLLTGAYVMGELSQGAQDRWLSFAKEHAKVVLLVEPGTPAGWSCLMRCRDTLLSRGAELLAPCPHAKQCPFVGTDGWCHEAVRLPRTSLHRRLKEGQLGYEDEKFCYLAATFDPDLRRTVPPGRIVHAPRHRHGHTHLVLCTRNGVLEPTIISRKYRELYRLVREAGWGDSVPLLKEDLT